MSKKRTPNFGSREQRIRKAYERLGTDNPKCIFCGEVNPLRLRLHHPAQHAFGAETVIICSSHHDDASDWQKDHPEKIKDCTNQLEPIGHWLLGLGDLAQIAANDPAAGQLREFLLHVAGKLDAFGRRLIELARTATRPAEGAP